MEGTPVRMLDLGPAGHLLEIQTSEDMPGVDKEAVKPRIIVVLDRSGSMGAWVKYATNNCIPGALAQVGYGPEDEVIFITFDTRMERVSLNGKNPTVRDLEKMNISSRGTTNMSGVIPELERVLKQGQSPAYHILVVSDGAISDQQATAGKAATARETLLKAHKNGGPRISCSLIRFLSSAHAQPDTRALTCVQLLCNSNDAVALVDVSNGGGMEEMGVLNLTEALVNGCKTSGVSSQVTVATVDGKSLLRASPSVATPTATLKIPCNGERVYILLSEPVEQIKLGNTVMPVINAGVPKEVSVLDTFVNLAGQGLKMSLVAMGGASADLKAKIEATIKYFDQVQTFLTQFQQAALLNADDDGVKNKAGVAARAKAVAARLKTSAVSAIDQLRQQLNADKVAGLNAQQTADWLRNVNQDNKSSKNLARRAEGSDFDAEARKAIPALAAACSALKSDGDDDFDNVSFYSQSNFEECIRSAEDLQGVAENLTMGDWMQAVGGVGVPFQAFTGNYVDPWQFRIRPDNLFAGQLLAEPDVWLTCVQAGSNTMSLACPGRPGSSITGVIPLRSLNPACYDIYMRSACRTLAEQQCSSMMRRMVACVPYDVIALSTAGVWSLCSKDDAPLTSVEKELLRDLRANVEHLIGGVYNAAPFKELYDDLCRPDPRPFLTGDRNVSNMLKCVAVLIKFVAPGDHKLQAAYRALYFLEAYQMASRAYKKDEGPAERKAALEAMFKIDLEAHATPVLELFEPEPEEPQHYDTLSLESLVLPQWVPKMNPYVMLCSVLADQDGIAPEAVFGADAPLLGALAAAQSLVCTGESDRVDTETRTAKVPDAANAEEAFSYLKKIQRDIYAADYARRLAEKRKTEDRIRTERVVNRLYELATYEEFVKELTASEITNREHPGFGMLLGRITGPNGDTCPARLQKLALLICGRDISNEAAGPVWANGNFFHGDWAQYQPIFGEKAAKAWKKLQAFHEKYGIYKYPRGEDTNRHGHSDAFPSYFALGFKSLYEMQKKVSVEVFAKYLREHCGEKGCCLPQVEMDRDRLKALAAEGGNNNNNNNDGAGLVLPRPQTAQEKTDAKRARRAARNGNKKNVKEKKRWIKAADAANAGAAAQNQAPPKKGKEGFEKNVRK